MPSSWTGSGVQENAVQLVLCAKAGCHLVSSGRCLEAERLWSPVQAHIDDELNCTLGRMLDGIRVDGNGLCVGQVQQGGPLPGDLLKKHRSRTMRRGERHLPRLSY